MTVARQSQTHGLADVFDPAEDRFTLAQIAAVHSPGADNRAAVSRMNLAGRSFHGMADPAEVVGTNRSAGCADPGWIARAEGEKVHDVQLTAAPAAAEPQAFPDGRIISFGVGGTGIEHDERGDAGTRASDLRR